MTEVDHFFAPQVYEEEVNTSYFRILFDFNKTQNESLTTDYKIKFQAKFPALSKSAKIIIKQEGEDAVQSLLSGENSSTQGSAAASEANGNQVNTAKQNQPDGYSAAIRKFVVEDDKFNVSYDLGMKMDVPLDPFAKMRLRYLWDWDTFSIRLVTSFDYYKIDRLFNETTSYFKFVTSEKNTLEFRTSYNWSYKSESENFNHNLNFYHSITDKIALAGNIYANAVIDGSSIYYNNYGLSTGYRNLLFSDWLFGEVSLGTNFPKSEDFKSKYFFTFRVDMIF